MGRLPRLLLTNFARNGVAGHHSFTHDQFAHCDLAIDRQQRAYDIVREYDALTVSRMKHPNSALSDALSEAPKFAVRGWVWAYDTAATIC